MALNAETTMKQAGEAGGSAFDRIARIPALDRVRQLTRETAGRVRGFGQRRPWMTSAVAVAILGIAGYAIYSSTASDEPKYITAVVGKGNIEDTVTALGNLQPRDYVDVGAQVSGQLRKLYVNIGDRVKQGQLLAEIDPQVLTAKVQQDHASVANLRAQLADRQAQAGLAAANYQRQQRLLAAGATSKADYDAARQLAASTGAQIAALRAQVNGASSALSGDSIQLGYTKIYAPMSGTVASITTKQGQTVIASQQAPVLLRIADLSTMTVWTQVSEADVSKLRVGMDAYFTTLGDPNKRWTGKLTQVQPTPTTVNNVVLYTSTFDVRNPDNKLMTQMTAQVFFVTASAHDVVTVPVSALHQGRGHRGGRTGPASPSGQASPAADSSGATGGFRDAGFDRSNLTPEMRARFHAIRAAMHTPGAKRYSVLVMQDDGTVERRRVVVGVSNRVTAQVLTGLAVGEKVVVGQESTEPAADKSNRSGRPGRFGGGAMRAGSFGPR